MNILLLYYTPFSQEDSFYWFYKQLILWLNKNGNPSELYFCYLNKKEEEYIENGLQLPDKHKFNSRKNVSAIVDFIGLNKIDVLFNFYLPVWIVGSFLLSIKKMCPNIKLIELIHNCPNHTLQLKKYNLENINSGYQANSIKEKIIKLFPKLYLSLLEKKVCQENRQAYKIHDAIVLLSPSYISEYLSLIGIRESNKVFAIPNPLAPKSFCNSNILVQDKEKEILFCGELRIEKSILTLLKVWKNIQNKVPDWKFIIVGDGIQMPQCKEVVKKWNIERVEFKGYVDSRPLIDRASVLCLSSVIEGLPTVFLEAMSMGVVPIGFNSFSAIYDMIDNWKNGVIVPAFNIDEYSKSLVKLMTEDNLRMRIAEAAKIKVQQYDVDIVGKQWNELFNIISK